MDWKGFAAGISLTAIGVRILRYALMPPKKVHKPRPEQAAPNDSLPVKIQPSVDTVAGYSLVSDRLDLWNEELLAATKQDTYRFGALHCGVRN